MKVDRVATIFCGVYFGYFIALAGLAISATDPKGGVILGQLSVFPGALVLTWIGMDKLVPADSPLNSGLFTFPLSLVIMYFAGWAIGGLWRQLNTNNRFALAVCGLYLVYIILLFGLALSLGGFIFGEWSVFPARLLLEWSGSEKLIPPGSWLGSGLFTFPLSLAIMYFVGLAIGRIWTRLRHSPAGGHPTLIGDNPPDIPSR